MDILCGIIKQGMILFLSSIKLIAGNSVTKFWKRSMTPKSCLDDHKILNLAKLIFPISQQI
ncbi:hypothetical protein CHS0354_005665 [Potamilus streckersoni]|uniref:Uncharacterized protein n=1 Tax=Potamilus streckersoni TaxID=2493646 RepID=A0AAE0VN67_9BIVA|nr:hypothetical protein CHS0354_005665 [Potamilus streckersoni]